MKKNLPFGKPVASCQITIIQIKGSESTSESVIVSERNRVRYMVNYVNTVSPPLYDIRYIILYLWKLPQTIVLSLF